MVFHTLVLRISPFFFGVNWCKIVLEILKRRIYFHRFVKFSPNLIKLQKEFTRFRQVPSVKSVFLGRFYTVFRVFQSLVVINAKNLFEMIAISWPSTKWRKRRLEKTWLFSSTKWLSLIGQLQWLAQVVRGK